MIKFIFATILLLLVVSYVEAFPLKPNSNLTYPHFCTVFDPDMDEIRYGSVPHCIRRVSQSKKVRVYRMYGIPQHLWHEFTIDHFIPLSLGGSNDIRNLWPQHKSMHTGGIETSIFWRVNRGEIDINTAINEIMLLKMRF